MRRLAPIEQLGHGEKVQNDLPNSPYENLEPATNGRSKSARAAHACETCRSLKVRCLSNVNPSVQKCQRCARLNLECLVKPRAPRKPRKRTDTRVGELERKVEALRAAISESSVPNRSVWPTAGSDMAPSTTGNQDHVSAFEKCAVVNISPASSSSSQGDFPVPLPPCDIFHGTFLEHNLLPPASPSLAVLTPSTATTLFNKFKSEVMPHFPLDLFLDECRGEDDAATVREKTPTLFLAAITAAAGDYDLDLHSKLNDHLADDFAKRVVIGGEKSLELVQALICAAAFYHPPDAFEKLKYYQYIHMAWSMATDLGLGSSVGQAAPGISQESPSMHGEDEMKRNMSRRTLVASYMSCLSVSRSMRRACMIHSGSEAEQCIEALQKSPYATPRDYQLIAWGKLEIIMKDVTRLLGLCDTDSPADVADIRTQCTIKAFEDRLERWKKELSSRGMHPSLEITYYYSKIYLHEIAFHTGDNFEDFRPPFRLTAPSRTSYNLPDLQTARFDSVITCMASAHSLIEVLLQLTPQTLCVIPTLMYIRASYAVFMLLKIFFISSALGSELGRVLDPTSVKVPYYLNRLVSHMQAAAQGGNCRLTTRFCGIFSRSRDWFRKHALRTDYDNGRGDERLLEPFRLLSLNDELEFQRCPLEPDMPDLHERAGMRVYDRRLDSMASLDKDGTNHTRSSFLGEPNQLDQGILASGVGIWHSPTPWSFENGVPDVVQAESGILEAQLGFIPRDDYVHIPLGEVDDAMDDSFDLALGFDFESHFWDFGMGNTNFETI